MAMNETIQKFMKRHCSTELFFEIMYEDVFPPITSTINADHLIQEINSELRFDAMKFAFVFEKAGGTIILNGERIGAQSLLESIDYCQSEQIRRQWDHSIANDYIPFYDKGPIEEEKQAVPFIECDLKNGNFGIKRLVRNKPNLKISDKQYKIIKGEDFDNREQRDKRIQELLGNISD
jgi:hypothetical protein